MNNIGCFRESCIRENCIRKEVLNMIILNRMSSRKEESKQGYIKITERCGDNKLIVEISGDHSEIWHTAPYLADLFGVYTNTINGKVAKIDNSDIISLDNARKYRVFKSDKEAEIQRAEYGLKAIMLLAYMIDNHRSRVLIEWIEGRITARSKAKAKAKVEIEPQSLAQPLLQDKTESLVSSKQATKQQKVIVPIIITTGDSPCLN